MLAGIGLPLYKAQSDKAENAVIKSNLRSVSNIVDTTIALGSTLYLDDLAGNLKVKGKMLEEVCFTGYADANGITTKSGAPAVGISKTTSKWCIRIAYVATNCSLADTSLNGCVDSAGSYRKDIKRGAICACTNGVAGNGTDITII